MAISFVQCVGNWAGSGSGWSSGALSTAISVTAGNQALCFVFTARGTIGSGVTDTAGDSWCPMGNLDLTSGNVAVFGCTYLAGGSITVKASGLTGFNGSPSMYVLEFSGATAMQVVQPPFNVFVSPLSLQSLVYPQHSFLFVAGIYDDGAATHNWTATGGTIALSQPETPGTSTGSVAYSSSASSGTKTITFSSTTMPAPTYETQIIGVVLTA